MNNLEADGVLTIYSLETGEVVEQFEGLDFYKELKELRKRDAFLSALESAGVDNWEGYFYGCELYNEYYRDSLGEYFDY